MFFYKVLTPISTTSGLYEVPAICVNTSKSTYTFTSVVLWVGSCDCGKAADR